MASSKPPAASKTTKIMVDVAKPGKTAPDASTRPLIVGHRPLVKDPTMVSSNEVESNTETADTPKFSPSRSPKIVTPITAPAEPAPLPDATEASKTDSSAEIAPSPAEIAMLKEQAPEVTETSTEMRVEEDAPAPSNAAAVDMLAEQAATRKKPGTVSDEEIAKAQAIHKLIEERTYNVPISKAHHSRNTALLIGLTVLLVVVGAAAFAVDAGVLKFDRGLLPF